MDLVTTVEEIQTQSDGSKLVTIGLSRDALMPRGVQLIRARARAMIATGLIDAGEGMARDIASAIREISFGEIDRLTEVEADRGNTVVVRVNA